MSAICGVFNRDGASVDRSVLTRMSEVARHRGPDGVESWVSGNVGLTQLLMATTPEARGESKPLIHEPTGSCIVFDGRLDNREELIARLDHDRASRHGESDMELVLLSFLRWGFECPANLLGDFAFAIYDGVNRVLFCARDISSIKPFYYAHMAGQFTFGSTVSQVLANPAVSAQPNEAIVAEVLSGLHLSRTETLYREIFRLPAAHSLQVDRHGIGIRRYWHPSAIRRIRYPQFADYAAHFEETFTDAVQCRLRSTAGVAVTLSGGKDSPSIAGTAQSLLWKDGAGKGLQSYSITYPGRSCDESALIADVVAKWKLDAHVFPFEKFNTVPDWAEQARSTRDLPEFPPFTALSAAQRHSVGHGTRVWLSGMGSESVLGGTDFPYLSQLRDRNFRGLAESFSNEKRRSGLVFAASRLSATLIWPILPQHVRRKIQSARHSFPKSGFLSPNLLRRSRLEERFHSALNAHEFSDLADWAIHQTVFSGERAFLYESYDRLNALNGIEERHPFEDRRLVEFSLAIPGDVKRNAESNKRLLLSLGERLLPPSVLANDIKFEAGCLFLDMLCRDPVRRILESSRTAQNGWVSEHELLAVYNRICQTYRATPKADAGAYKAEDYRELFNLWTVVAMDFWLRGSIS